MTGEIKRASPMAVGGQSIHVRVRYRVIDSHFPNITMSYRFRVEIDIIHHRTDLEDEEWIAIPVQESCSEEEPDVSEKGLTFVFLRKLDEIVVVAG